MENKKKSPRQELGDFTGRGDLRYSLESKPGGLSDEAIDLLVTIVLRYCEPPRKKRKH